MHAVDGEEATDAARVNAESAGEFEREMDCWIVDALGWVVHENWKELVEGDRVHGEEGVTYKIDV